jgi:hypothetical protein
MRRDEGAVRLLGIAIGLGLVGCGSSGGGGKTGVGGHGGVSDAAVDQTLKPDAGDAGAGGKAGLPVVLATGFDVAGSLASDRTNVFFGANVIHHRPARHA